MDKRNFGLIVGLLCFSASAQAGLIQWTYEATISQISSDPLNIHGETAAVTLTFDDSNTWQSIGGWLYFPTASADASITGGHTAALKSTNPAGVHAISSKVASIVEEVGTADYVDLVIDGFTTTMRLFQGDSAVIPLAGDNLALTHLPTSIPGALFDYPIGTVAYRLENASVAMSRIPEPANLALIGFGFAFLGYHRRKRTGR